MPNINPYGKDDARYYQKNLNDKASKIKEVLAHNKKYGYPITQGDFVRNSVTGKTIKPANQALRIVSPEFDLLSLGTGFYNTLASQLKSKVASLIKNKFKNTIFNSTTSDAANLSSKYVDDFPSGEYTFNPSLTNTAPIKADEKMKTFLESIPDKEEKANH